RDEEGPGLHLRTADVHEAGRADAVERQRIGEDVARALEDGADQRADRKGDGGGPRDPADRRSTVEVRLDEADVGRRAGTPAHREPDDQREDELRLVRTALAHRRGAREDEQRREDPQPDEVAEREVHDPGEPVDQRVPGSEEPVDPTRRQPRDEDLQRDCHAREFNREPSAPRRPCIQGYALREGAHLEVLLLARRQRLVPDPEPAGREPPTEDTSEYGRAAPALGMAPALAVARIVNPLQKRALHRTCRVALWRRD